jgi:hypothetical protein
MISTSILFSNGNIYGSIRNEDKIIYKELIYYNNVILHISNNTTTHTTYAYYDTTHITA